VWATVGLVLKLTIFGQSIRASKQYPPPCCGSQWHVIKQGSSQRKFIFLPNRLFVKFIAVSSRQFLFFRCIGLFPGFIFCLHGPR
jgi:hypothetical protein